MEVKIDKGQVLTFEVKISGEVKTTDFRLRVESGRGYDVNLRGTYDTKAGQVSFAVPKLVGIVDQGERPYVMEMVADSEAFFAPVSGVLDCVRALTVEARSSSEVAATKLKIEAAEQGSEKIVAKEPLRTAPQPAAENDLLGDDFLKF